MKIITEYVYDHSGEPMCCVPRYRKLPSVKAKLTGNYKEVNGQLYVEINEVYFFWFWRKSWFHEDDFRFLEVEHFTCGGDDAK